MNITIHVMLCILFLFSAWVYFLKCEINELHRRLDDHTGEKAPSTTTEPASAMAPAMAAVPVRKANVPQSPSKQTHAAIGQHSGIPTWTIQ
jgi:hypothetical protein